MKNKNGFTLIEIIVSLMIASIAMIIATTLILNSMGFFNRTAVSDNDKQVLDSIKNYVQNEIMYATDVVIQSEYPRNEDGSIDEEWHYLYVFNNKLYKDDDCNSNFITSLQVFSDDFYYKQRKLYIDTRGFDNFRVDFKFYLTDKGGLDTSYNNDYIYKTSTTIELLNMKDYITNKGGMSLLAQTTFVNLNNSTGYIGNKVFYKKGSLIIDEPKHEETLDTSGTVADQIGCMRDNNNKGEFIAGTKYYPGDMIYITINEQKTWYRCVTTAKEGIHASTPNDVLADASLRWKKIDAYHDVKSGYLKGDRVIDKDTGNYYECVLDTANKGDTIRVTNTMYWTSIEKPTIPNKICNVKYEAIYKGTVAGKDDDLMYDDIPFYTEIIGSGQNNIFTRYNIDEVWLKLDNGSPNTKPGEKNDKGQYVWQKIQMVWDETSGYDQGDIIYYKGNFYKAKQKSRDGSTPAYFQYGDWITNSGWNKINYNPSTGDWNG